MTTVKSIIKPYNKISLPYGENDAFTFLALSKPDIVDYSKFVKLGKCSEDKYKLVIKRSCDLIFGFSHTHPLKSLTIKFGDELKKISIDIPDMNHAYDGVIHRYLFHDPLPIIALPYVFIEFVFSFYDVADELKPNSLPITINGGFINRMTGPQLNGELIWNATDSVALNISNGVIVPNDQCYITRLPQIKTDTRDGQNFVVLSWTDENGRRHESRINTANIEGIPAEAWD
jgi:hypothetical protein